MRIYQKIASVMAAVMFLQTPVTAFSSYASVRETVRTVSAVPESGTENKENDHTKKETAALPVNGIPARIAAARSGPSETDSNAGTESPSDAAHGSQNDKKQTPDAGNLKIEIVGAADAKESRWIAELIPAGDPDETASDHGEYTSEFELAKPKSGSYANASVLFSDVPAGKYRLVLTPDAASETAYLPYEQEVAVGRNATSLRLINGDPKDYGYEKNSDRYGVLVMGDIDGDGEISETDLGILTKIVAGDEELIVTDEEDGKTDSNMKPNQNTESGSAYYDKADLNGDGIVNLLDVSCFAKYYRTGIGRTAKPSTSPLITKDDVIVVESASNATEKNGSVAAIFSGTAETPLTVETKKPISKEAPAVIATEFAEAKPMEGLVIDPVAGSKDSIVDGEIVITDADGKDHVFRVSDGKVTEVKNESKPIAQIDASETGNRMVYAAAVRPLATIAETVPQTAKDDGDPEKTEETANEGPTQAVPIVIDLGGQVAVKKITIRVTKTLAEDPKLVDISKVEFYDDMADRIDEPMLSVPERLAVENGDAEFTLNWKKMPNVTGYEVTVSGRDLNGAEGTDTYPVETNSLTVDSLGFGNGKLENGYTYKVTVRSVNGDWKSSAAEIDAKPEAASVPPAPENIVIDPAYKKLTVSWKKMKSTETYSLFYRETAGSADGAIPSIQNISDTRYELKDLKDDTEYEIWLTGTNKKGTGPESIHYRARTSTLNPPVTPNYKLINIPDAGERLTRHVTGATYGDGKADMSAVVDGDFGTAWVRDDWDAGYEYDSQGKSPIVSFDDEYEMDTIVLVPDDSQPYALTAGRIYYWDQVGVRRPAKTRTIRKASNGKYYYMFQAREPFTTDKVQVMVTTGYGRRISAAEMKFYYYDDTENDILDLYADIYHVSLKEGVGMDEINALRERLKIPDEVSGELHPKKAELEAELDNAEQILNEGGTRTGIMIVDNKDTQKPDGHISFRGGLNVYQPLGVTALAGDTLKVYCC